MIRRAAAACFVAALGVAVAGCAAPLPFTVRAEPTDAFPVTWEGTKSSGLVASEAEDARLAEDQRRFDQAVEAGSIDAYLAYVKESRSSDRRQAALGRALAKAAEDPAQELTSVERIADVAPDAPIPPKLAVQLVGPRGMRVKDVIAMTAQGLSEDVIASRIAGGEHLYKDFSLEELNLLRQAGVSDAIVKAMLQSHAAARKAGKEEAERERLRKEIAELRALVEKQQASGATAAASGGPVVQTEKGPMDQMACMAARLGALKACEQIPWPGSIACESAAKGQFPCE